MHLSWKHGKHSQMCGKERKNNEMNEKEKKREAVFIFGIGPRRTLSVQNFNGQMRLYTCAKYLIMTCAFDTVMYLCEYTFFGRCKEFMWQGHTTHESWYTIHM